MGDDLIADRPGLAQRDRGIVSIIPRARSARARRCMLASFDAVAWAVALAVALVLRYDFAVPRDQIGRLGVTIVIAVTLPLLRRMTSPGNVRFE